MSSRSYLTHNGTIIEVSDELVSPSVARFGPGPEGFRCGSCANLSAIEIDQPHGQGHQTIYYCCIDGQARRVTWPACDRFVEAPLASTTASP
jgi:hypothetical protein